MKSAETARQADTAAPVAQGTQRPFDTLLVANRGEIALRIMRTARELGLRTVAVYSSADRDSPHVAAADRAVLLGDGPARDSYLQIDRIVEAARASGAQAVHPGYGFLAENAEFAAAVEEAGLVFVGPSAEAIRLMGNKAGAKKRMLAEGVPCIPGYQGAAQDDAAMSQAAEEIGFPLMVKSAAGGGGRGMRLVHEAGQLRAALASARSEALAAFGSDELILERAITGARHIEVQVFADSHGNTVHIGERDCSVQRRHQKLIEESPSPAVTPALRERFGAAAVQAARSIDYRGAGTIEFLLDSRGEFYFMEMNTRLQVEHGVTELLTGLDLVEWQLRVAAGEPLPLRQEQIAFDGHAIEVRLCLEDPALDFIPQTGEILLWLPAPGVRTDSALKDGLTISPHYDSMAAKVLAHGRTRHASVARLATACEQTVLLGVRNNLGFLRDCLRHPEFVAGHAETSFIATHLPAESRVRPALPAPVRAAAAIVFGEATSTSAWTNSMGLYTLVQISSGVDTKPEMLQVRVGRPGIRVASHPSGENEMALAHCVRGATVLSFELDNVRHQLHYAIAADGTLWLHHDGSEYQLRNTLHDRTAGSAAGGAGQGALRATLAGRLIAVNALAGATVRKGETLLVLESMKMEHAMVAPFDGTVQAVFCAQGEQVMPGKVLVQLQPLEQAPAP